MKEVNKGFTLIELLTVILILGIIALIAIPTFVNLLEESKKNAFKATINQVANSIENDCIKNNLKNDNHTSMYDFSDKGITPSVDIKGKIPSKGYATVDNDCKVSIYAQNDDYYTFSSKNSKLSDVKIKERNKAKIYGLKYDGNNNFTRLKDAVGMVANAGVNDQIVRNDFDNAEIYNEIEDVTDSYGNIFVKIPKFYIKKVVNGISQEWYISKIKQDDSYYLPACFYDEEKNIEFPYILYGKYPAALENNKLISKPNIYELAYDTLTILRQYALNNNNEETNGYQLVDIHALDAIQVLFYVEFSTLNSQSIMAGYNDGYDWQITGITNSIKSSSGSIDSLTDMSKSMKYRGIENLYGYMWEYFDGVNVVNSTKTIYVNRNAKTYSSNGISGDYKPLSYHRCDSRDWIKRMGFDSNNPFAQFPVEIGGDELTNYSDFYYSDESTPVKNFLATGSRVNKTQGGINLISFTFDPSRGIYPNIGTRLLKTPF